LANGIVLEEYGSLPVQFINEGTTVLSNCRIGIFNPHPIFALTNRPREDDSASRVKLPEL